MPNNIFYHEDLVLKIDHTNRIIYSGHIEGEAYRDSYVGTEPSSVDSTNEMDNQQIVVGPKQFGDKSSEHDYSQDSVLIDVENQMDTGYFEGPFQGNVYVRWNMAYYHEMADVNNPIPNYEETVNGDSLVVLDRYHQLSDVVKHDESGKIGLVNKIHKRAYAEIIGVKKLLVDIDCQKLKNVEKFFPGTNEQLVIYKSWLGRVTNLTRDIIVRFPDGARLRVPETAIEDFEPLFNTDIPDMIFCGAAIKGDARDFKVKSSKFVKETNMFNATWLKQLHILHLVEVLIIKVILKTAKVDWMVYKPSNSTDPANPTLPPSILRGSSILNLKSINSNPYLYCYTGDVWYYQIKSSDKIYNLNENNTVSKMLYKINMKENLNHLKYTVKTEKELKESTELKSKENVQKLSSSKSSISKPSSKKKPLNLTKNHSNVSKLTSVIDSRIHQLRKCQANLSRKDSSEFIINRRLRQITKRKFLRNIEKKCRNYSNRNTETIYKSSGNSNSRSKENSKVMLQERNNKTSKSKSLSVKKMNITKELIMDFLNKLKVGQWVPVHLVLIETVVDVLWQNGTMSTKIPSSKLLPEIFNVDEYDFFPGDFVCSKSEALGNGEEESKQNIFGCIVKAQNLERLVTVQWFTINETKECVKVGKLTPCGSYTIKHHKNHQYHIGDIVTVDPACSKTKHPAGVVKCVHPYRGTLSIKWFNTKESQLNPTELTGVVWNIIFDDIFSSDMTFEDYSQENDMKFRNIFDTHIEEKNQPTIELVERVIRCITEFQLLDKSGGKVVKQSKDQIELFEDIKQSMIGFSQICTSKSLQAIYQTHFPVLFTDYVDGNFVKIEGIEDQLIPSTSLDTSCYVEKNKAESNRTLSDRETTDAKANQLVRQRFLTDPDILRELQDLKMSLVNWLQINNIFTDYQSPEKESLKLISNPVLTELITSNKIKNTSRQCSEISGQNAFSIEDTHPPPNFDNISVFQNDSPKGSVIDQKEGPAEFSDDDSMKDIINTLPETQLGTFEMVSSGEEQNKFFKQQVPASKRKAFINAWRKDCEILSSSLPKGIWVKNFESRIDLLSVMIEGPADSPYQHTLFFFDLHLPTEYPLQPPLVHYISIVESDKINPNLYPDGRVCLSLLGTWIGRGSENWNPNVSTLLQLIVSIQGLILVAEPYFNEAGYENKKDTEEGMINSQRYNESVITSMVVATTILVCNPPPLFKSEIVQFYRSCAQKYISLLKCWASLTEENACQHHLKLEETASDVSGQQSVDKPTTSTTLKVPSKDNLVVNHHSTKTTTLMTVQSDTHRPESVLSSFRTDIPSVPNTIAFTKNATRFLPSFSLAPVSKGFSLTLNQYIPLLEQSIQSHIM